MAIIKVNLIYKKYSHQQGAVLPVFAVMLGSIIAVMFALYLNSVMLSRNSNLFRSTVKNICRNLADSNIYNSHQSIASAFAHNVKNAFSSSHPVFGGNKFKLKKAVLLLPMMPVAGQSLAYGNDFTPVGNGLSTYGSTFTDASIDPTCANGVNWAIPELGVDSDCKIQINVSNINTDTVGVQKVPTGAMSSSQNAANTVGCYFEGEFTGFQFNIGGGKKGKTAGSKIPVVANYTFWRPLRGNFADHLTTSPSYATAPGLMLAISTHMTTFSNLPQYNWSQMNDANSLSAYSPIFDDSNYLSSTNTDVSYVDDMSSSPAGNGPRPVPSPGTQINNFPGGLSGSNASPLGASDFYEMLLACSNPATLVRNMFASVFLQHAARHAHLRSSTEVLHVSTQHRNTIDGSDVNAISADRNFPVQMIKLGTDLLTSYDNLATATRAFQIPYIYYHSGAGGAELANGFGHAKGGQINPFADIGGWGSHHAVVANQLRACAHLYKSGVGSGPELIKVPHANLYGINSTFESIDNTDYIDVNGHSTQSAFGAMNYFDQNCPFGTGEGSCSTLTVTRGSLPNTNNTGVDAISIVGMLGSTQSCPYYQANGNFATTGRCDKPADDIRPDTRALLEYVDGTANSGTVAPGIFPIMNANANPFSAGSYVTVGNTNLPLILITHKGLRTAEATAISDFLTANPEWMNRPVIIVFIPTNTTELGLAGNFTTAFKLEDTNYRNRVFILDPREPQLRTAITGGADINYCAGEDIGDCDDDDFADYFADLITPGSSGRSDMLIAEHSVINRANYIFNEITGNVAKKH